MTQRPTSLTPDSRLLTSDFSPHSQCSLRQLSYQIKSRLRPDQPDHLWHSRNPWHPTQATDRLSPTRPDPTRPDRRHFLNTRERCEKSEAQIAPKPTLYSNRVQNQPRYNPPTGFQDDSLVAYLCRGYLPHPRRDRSYPTRRSQLHPTQPTRLLPRESPTAFFGYSPTRQTNPIPTPPR